MRSWFAKVLMLVAVIIITAHNTVPHDHDLVTLAAHHGPDHENDEHNVFSFNFLAHSFTHQEVTYDFVKHIVIDEPVWATTCTEATACSNIPFQKPSYAIAQGHSLAPQYYSSSGFCGPPFLI